VKVINMKSRLFRTLIFGALTYLGFSAQLYAANSLIVGTLVSDPTDAQTGVRVEKGLKGLRVRMRWVNDLGVDQPGGFPIGIATASVNLTINGSTNLCAANQISPAVGTCGFVSGPFGLTGAVDTVIVYFNGTFPVSASVQVAVSGVKAFDGTLEDINNNSISFSVGSNTPRTAESLELVFDISGSMGLPVATADALNPSPKQRIQALKQSADELFTLMGSHAMLGDKIGQLFFSTDVTDASPLGAAHDRQGVLVPLQGIVDGKNPTFSTAMGKGLNAGVAAIGGDGNPRKFVFIFSDGEQNTAPNIDFPVPAGGPISVAGVNVPNTITVCTITMGVQSAPGYALQDQMAQVGCPRTHSLFVNAESPSFAQADLDSYFADALTYVLGGDKLEIVKDINGSVTAPGTDSQKFLGNARDTAMSILLSWDQGRELRPKLKLIAPDGTAVDLNDGKAVIGTTRAYIDLRFPLHQGGTTISPKGQWELDITPPVVMEGGGTLNYHLMVISDNETIASESTIDIRDAGTGEPIPIKVTVNDGGAPVTGATVSAILIGPDNGLGDILAKANNPSGTPNANGDLVGSAANGKLILLLQDPNFLALLKNHSLPLIVLTDPGNTGTYTGTFTNTLKEGHYQFLINIRGTSIGNGDFERARKLTVFVRPKPDPGNTGLTVVSAMTQPGGTVLVHLRATPKDRFGSFVGPDYLPVLDITCLPCTVSTPIADDLRGSYDVTYQVASAAINPTIGLVVFGQNVTQTTLNDLKHPGGKWVASFHIGGTIPHSNLTLLSGSVSLGGDLEYRLTNTYSLETYLGYDRFSASVGNAFSFTNLSERFKATFGAGPWRPFAFAGVGGYFGSSGGNHSGINTGAGLQYWFGSKRKFAVEGTYTFHTVFISGGNATYSTLLGGVRYVFK
jgi:hypothetical protein